MSPIDFTVVSHRENRGKLEMEGYGVTGELDELGRVYTEKMTHGKFADQCEIDVAFHPPEYVITNNLADEQARTPGKGKHVLLLLDAAAYVSVPLAGLDIGSPYSICGPSIMTTLQRRFVEVLRSRYASAFPHQIELLFQPSPDESLRPLRDDVIERFHILIDKQLTNVISEQEQKELATLEQMIDQREIEDPQAQKLERQWSERFDKAIGHLERINEKLEKLLASEK